MNNSEETLGERIKRLRLQKGLTLRALANKVDVSVPFLSDLERNRRTTAKLPQIAEALGEKLETLQDADQRLTSDLRDWIAQNPSMVRVIKELRASGLTADQIHQAIRAVKGKRKARSVD